MDARQRLLAAQTPGKTVEDFEAEAAAELEYRQSDEYKRAQHESYQDLWEAKAKREGWEFHRRPYIGAQERAQQEQQKREREAAELRERLAALEAQL